MIHGIIVDAQSAVRPRLLEGLTALDWQCASHKDLADVDNIADLWGLFIVLRKNVPSEVLLQDLGRIRQLRAKAPTMVVGVFVDESLEHYRSQFDAIGVDIVSSIAFEMEAFIDALVQALMTRRT